MPKREREGERKRKRERERERERAGKRLGEGGRERKHSQLATVSSWCVCFAL